MTWHRLLRKAMLSFRRPPIGMHGHAEGESPVPTALLRSEHILFDMVYRPMKTQFILDGEALGCVTILGLEMLLNQAVLQFERWTGKTGPETVMRDAPGKSASGNTVVDAFTCTKTFFQPLFV